MSEGHHLVVRRQLVERVRGPDGKAPTVTTIVAPAGYGKTVLLRTLRGELGASGLPYALHLSLGECENHIGLFVDLLVTALRDTFAHADVRPLLAFKKTVPLEEYGLRLPYVLGRAVEQVTAETVTLLLDDVQHLRPGEPLTELISGLLGNDACPLNYILASRQQLPFDLSRFRQAGDIVELTSKELEFSRDEVRELLEGQFGREVPVGVAERVWSKTHGWAGVLGLLLMLTRDSSAEALDTVLDTAASGDQEPVADFVVIRLLDEFRPQVRYFMKVVSILDRVDEELAQAIFDPRELTGSGRVVADARRSFIKLPASELPTYLRELEEAQILVPSRRGGGAEFNPLVGASLRSLFKREDAAVYREAHRRAASWHLANTDPVSAVALDHLVEAGDFGRLLAVLADEAGRFFAAGYHRHLAQWLLALESHYASLPFWANYYLGRVYAMLGDWDRARDCLDRCKRDLPERQKAGDMWRWQPRLCIGFAGMYWRRGMHSDASTYCRRGLDFLRQVSRRGAVAEENKAEATELQLQLLHLLGTLKMEAGSYEKAWDVFEEARGLAEGAGLTTQEANALKNLGLIATRKGDALGGAQLFEDALSRLDREIDLELYATVASHLGASHLITGRYDLARSLLEDALAIRLDTGHPSSIAQTLTALGIVEAAAGRAKAADAAFRRAAHMLDQIGNLKTRAQVLNRYAAFLANQGRIHEAQAWHDQAEALIGGLLRAEPPLAALHRETAMEIAIAKARYDDALSHLNVAVERHEKLGANYNVARLYWRAAAIYHRLFLAELRSTPESVVSYLELAAAQANAHGYVFGRDEQHRELILVGRALGHPETVKYCDRALERLDGAAPAEDAEIRLPEPAATRYDRFQQRMEREDEYLVYTRDGKNGAAEVQIEEMVEGRSSQALVVLLNRQEMVNFGEVISLSQKRVILPLLVHFLRHPTNVFTMAELAEHVWESNELTESMKTKVKVAISRLRSLLGKTRDYILTSRRSDSDGSSVVTYGLAPDLEFYLVQAADQTP